MLENNNGKRNSESTDCLNERDLGDQIEEQGKGDSSCHENESEKSDCIQAERRLGKTLQSESSENTQEKKHDVPLSSLSSIEQWIAVNPPTRQVEVDYLRSENLGFPMKISDAGDLQQPFRINSWVFLLVVNATFPKRTFSGNIPVHIYLVTPSVEELEEKINRSSLAQVHNDSSGLSYVDFGASCEKEYERYCEGFSSNNMCASFLEYTRNWVKSTQNNSDLLVEKETKKSRFSFSLFPKKDRDNQKNVFSTKNRPKYVNGKTSKGNVANPRCQKVVLSNRAFIQIFNESQARIQTETGGLLLGHFEKGIWYVVEASDPGINAKFFGAYHEGDDVYENHVCSVISRTYKYPLVFLGMWHRHPGSLDTFSGTDDGTNYKYAESAGNGCISAIINYDPEFRITFYYVEHGGLSQVLYTCVDVEVGDDKFINPQMMQIATLEDVKKREVR